MISTLIILMLTSFYQVHGESVWESGTYESSYEIYDVAMTTRILDTRGNEYWTGSVRNSTLNGETVNLQLAGDAAFIDLTLVPYAQRHINADKVVVFVHGRIWARQDENRVHVRNIFRSVEVLLDEPIVFVPFGVHDNDDFIDRMRTMKRSWLQRVFSKRILRREGDKAATGKRAAEKENPAPGSPPFMGVPPEERSHPHDGNILQHPTYTMELEFVISRSPQP